MATISQGMNINKGNLIDIVEEHYKKFYKRISQTSAREIAEDYFSEKRTLDQLKLIEKILGIELRGKKILDVGSGYGMFIITAIKYFGMLAYGIEPHATEFGKPVDLSRELLELNKESSEIVKENYAERIEFEDDTFDIVYSNYALEHVSDPGKFIFESVRVLKSGGYLFFVFPNFGSFYESHYGLFWIPYMPKVISKVYVKKLGRDPSFIDSLQFLTKNKIMNIVSKINNVKLITLGYEIWEERLNNIDLIPKFSALNKLRCLVLFLKKYHLIKIVTILGKIFHFYTPIILVLKKTDSP